MAKKKDDVEVSKFINSLNTINQAFSDLSKSILILPQAINKATDGLKDFTKGLTDSIITLNKTLSQPVLPTPAKPSPLPDKPKVEPVEEAESKVNNSSRDNNNKSNDNTSFFLSQVKFGTIAFILKSVADQIGQYQASLASLGFLDSARFLKTSIDSAIPSITDLSVKSTILSLGLEDNIQGIGKYLARSELLGENTQNIANSIRSFTLSFGLTTSEQATFTKTIADSALRYNTSTEKLTESVASFAEKISISSMLGNASTLKAFTSLESQVQRFLPSGTLEKFFGPFLSGGLETQGETAFLGIEDSIRRLTSLEGVQDPMKSFEDLRSVISSINNTGQNFARSFGSLGSREFTEAIRGILPNVGPEIFILGRQIEDAIAKVTPEQIAKEATIQQTNTILRSLQDRLLEPLAILGRGLLTLIDVTGNLGSYVISILVVGSIIKVGSLISQFATGTITALRNISAQLAINNSQNLSATRSNLGRGGRPNLNAPLTTATPKPSGAQSANANAKASSALAGAAAGAAAGKAAGGIFKSALGIFGGPIGLIATLGITFLPDIISLLRGGNENTKKIAEQTKPKPDLLSSRGELEQANRVALLNRLIEVNRDMQIAKTSDVDAVRITLQEQANNELVEIQKALKDLGASIQARSLMRK